MHFYCQGALFGNNRELWGRITWLIMYPHENVKQKDNNNINGILFEI